VRRSKSHAPDGWPVVLVDSGGHAARHAEPPLDVGAYCDYLLAHRDRLTRCVALDMFEPGLSSIEDRNYDIYLYMRGRGLDPIAVFHEGDSIDALRRYLRAGADSIGLSADGARGKHRASYWYASVWPYLVDDAGNPLVPVHCFGDTREAVLCAFPWASADDGGRFTKTPRFGNRTSVYYTADEPDETARRWRYYRALEDRVRRYGSAVYPPRRSNRQPADFAFYPLVRAPERDLSLLRRLDQRTVAVSYHARDSIDRLVALTDMPAAAD
jgi:hypothetical protein